MILWLSRLQAFLVATAFYPWIVGAAVTPRWAVASLSVYFMTPLAFLFCVYCFAVLPVDAAVKWSIVAGAFSFGTRLNNEHIRAIILAFAAGVSISGLLAVYQWQGGDWVPQAVSPAGLFVNKNYLGEAAVLALVAMGMIRQKYLPVSSFRAWLVVGCLTAVVLSTSRASWLALFVAGVLVTFRPWTRLRTLLVFGLFGVLIIVMAEYGGLNSMAQRLELWRSGVLEFRWFGAGAPLEPLHNEFLQVVYELGLGAAVPLGAGWFVAYRNPGALPFVVAVAIIATFGFPLHMPATAWFIAVIAGHLVVDKRLPS